MVINFDKLLRDKIFFHYIKGIYEGFKQSHKQRLLNFIAKFSYFAEICNLRTKVK